VKPSEVDLRRTGAFILCGTVGRVEREVTLGLVIFALATRGDEWRPIPIADVRATALRLIDDRVEPWFSMFSMPTWAWRGIDFDDAVKGKILEAFPVAGVDSYRVHDSVVKFLMTRRRAPRECPKCGSASPCVDWIRAEHESRIHVGGEEVESLYECPVHGHFGTNDNGCHFATAELRCASPSGELVELR
jgi:hypothetical protein